MLSFLRRSITARQKVGATVAAIVLGAGVALVAAPLSASAHTATLSVSADCTTSTGAAVVTWKITNDYDEVLNVTTSDNAAIPVGTTLAATHGGADTTATFTQKIDAPAAGKTATASVDFRWSGDNYTQLSTKPVTVTIGADCTIPAPPEKCITALWKIPGGDAKQPFAGPQKLVDSTSADCGDLTAVTPPTQCGAYQVDSYLDDSTTAALLKGGYLTKSHVPAEHLWRGSTPSYKYIQFSAVCAPPTVDDATASASIGTAASCSTDGTLDFSKITNAHWENSTDLSDGSRLAIAETGHVFSNGTDHLVVTYTFPTKLASADCLPKDAAAAVTVATAATCDAAGTVSFDGIVNASWDDLADTTDGSRTATATAGHLFADGTTTAMVTYTIPAQLTTCAVTPPTVTPPVVTPTVVSPPTVKPPTTNTVVQVDAPTVTPEKTTPEKTSTTKTDAPSVLASTGFTDSTPIAGSIALLALLFGAAITIVTSRRRQKTSGE
ncbi:hypothetical protein BH11ACT2_BH11ACT2_17760 [soil metagenome]